MIRIISGKPGGGKSYYAVKHLRDNHYHNKKGDGVYYPKNGVTVFSNINELKLEHKNIDDILKNISVEEFFSKDYQEKITKKYPKVVYFIDEAQFYFHKKFYDKDVFFYFQTHRHLGHDIYLITQNPSLMPSQIVSLAEFEIVAQSRSVSLFGELKYLIKTQGEIVDRKLLKKDKAIFALYKSMLAEETEPPKNPFIKYLVMLLVLFGVACYTFYNYFLMPDSAQAVKGEGVKKDTVYVTEIPSNKKNGIDQVDSGKQKAVMVLDTKLHPVKLSYVLVDDKILVVDPVSNQLLPLRRLPYNVSVDQVGRGLLILAYLPERPDVSNGQNEELTP